MESIILDKIQSRSAKIAIIGLGYVGLPLAVEFGKIFGKLYKDNNGDKVNND